MSILVSNSLLGQFNDSFELTTDVIVKEPIVSVQTLAYNHENTIAKCLDSILSQKTSFPIEIIIGEDCSTDMTKDIITEYQHKYPEVIRIITAKNNVGMIMNTERCAIACRGKYSAICEGDDYWTDPYKLQKQVDYLENHPNCSLCFHSHSILYDNGTLVDKKPPLLKDSYSTEDILPYDGSFMATNSMLYRTEINQTKPQWVMEAPAGDISLMLYCAFCGNIGYIDENMSVYRSSSNSAWAQLHRNNLSFTISTYKKIVKMYKEMDIWSQGKYHSTLKKTIWSNQKFLIKLYILKYFKINLLSKNSKFRS